MDRANDYTIRVVVDALRVLETVARNNGRLGLGEIASEAKLDKSKTFRILETLGTLGYVRKESGCGNFGLGETMHDLGALAVSGPDVLSVARPYMHRLWDKYDETTNLAILDGARLVYLQGFESKKAIRMTFNPGISEEVHTSGLGKAILAFLPPTDVDAILYHIKFDPRTPNSIADINAFKKELEVVRARGYALDDEESQQGCRCVGAPIFDANNVPVAAISVSGPTSRMPMAMLHQIGQDIRVNALACSELLGNVYHKHASVGAGATAEKQTNER